MRGWRIPGSAVGISDDFDHVNQCAYFDYQRERVFLRTNKAVKRACLNLRKRQPRPKPTRLVEIRDMLEGLAPLYATPPSEP